MDKKEYMKQYREANKDKIREQRKQYYEANKDEIREQRKQYYYENRDKENECQKRWRINQKGGIYRIVCPDGCVYFGSSSQLKTRFCNHKSKIRNNKHDNHHINELSLSHSPENFRFEVLAFCDDDDVRVKMEYSLINNLNCVNINGRSNGNRTST